MKDTQWNKIEIADVKNIILSFIVLKDQVFSTKVCKPQTQIVICTQDVSKTKFMKESYICGKIRYTCNEMHF